MRVTKILREEHQWIRRLVDCLEKAAGVAEEEGELDFESASEALNLFQIFSDGRHQEKEELLFPHLKVLATVGEAELLRELQEEHGKDQVQMMHMRSNLVGAARGDPVGGREFRRRATEYIALQRRHMAKENALMLPMAERLLTVAQEAEILSGFLRIENRGVQTSACFRKIAALCEQVGVPCEAPH